MPHWKNWSGSVHFTPSHILKPVSEEGVRTIVLKAREQGQIVRAVGSGHSSTPLVVTPDVLIDLCDIKGLIKLDEDNKEATFRAGTTIEQAGRELAGHGYQLYNIGDIDHQKLVGAFATGTHGSGKNFKNLPGMMTACRLVDGMGDIRHFSDAETPEEMRACRLSLGVLGIMTEVTVRVKKAVPHVRREYCTTMDALYEHRERLIEENEMFDYYWYPQRDKVKLRTCNTVESDKDYSDIAEEQKDRRRQGFLNEVLPKDRQMKFDEMEYAIPIEQGPDCFAKVRERVLAKHTDTVWWRILYRTVAADDAYLSPFSGQDCVTIAILQNIEQPYEEYFRDIEPILLDHGGRPHWGKKFFVSSQRLKERYPEFENFEAIRKKIDPDKIFMNSYLKNLLFA